MRKCILIVGSVAAILSACTTPTPPKEQLGQIVMRNLICNSQETCERGLQTACKKGGVVHSITPGFVIQYNCNR
jgi:hypothetical protein